MSSVMAPQVVEVGCGKECVVARQRSPVTVSGELASAHATAGRYCGWWRR